jgi:hypothetical protein
MLARNLRAPLGVRLPALSLTFFANMLAPTVIQGSAYTLNSFFIVSLIPPKYLS